MIKTVPTKDLKVGMFVILKESWIQHSFLKPKFKITSRKQIEKIIADGIGKVQVDTLKSEVVEDRDILQDLALAPRLEDSTHARTVIPVPEKFVPMDVIGDELRAAIEDTRIPPQTKAKAVYDHSIKMMNNVLTEPSAENILSGKKMISDIVDHILADDDTADCLAQITSHDYYTYTHSVNVGMFSVLLAKAVFGSSSDHDMRELGAGFFLHDLGKCDVPHDLINKPGDLAPREWDQMRRHPSRGNEILTDNKQLTRECGLIIMQHHEREDGSGYPLGLARDDIHLYARICSIADVYDALTSTRAYKVKVPPFEALRIMKEEMLHHFQRDIFEEFVLIFH